MGFPKAYAGVAMAHTRMRQKIKVWMPSLVVAVALAAAPVVFNSINVFLLWMGIEGVVPMTVGEYSTYLGTVAAIIWAVYAFTRERAEMKKRADDQKKRERPNLDIVLHGDGAITIQNIGASDALCVSNCDIPLIGRLCPGEAINLIWLESDNYDELVFRYEDAILIDDYVLSTGLGLDVNIFAYSIHGVPWSYECDLRFNDKSRVVITEG